MPRAAASATIRSLWPKCSDPPATGWATAQLKVVRTLCTPLACIRSNTGARFTPGSSSGPSRFMPTKPDGVKAAVEPTGP